MAGLIWPGAEQILARAQGNPFFVSEIIESLIERGIIAEVADAGLDGRAGVLHALSDRVPQRLVERVGLEGFSRSDADAGEALQERLVVGMEGFGASAPAPKLYEGFGITAGAVADRVRALL